jgi:TPR repeat protein
MFYGMAAEHGDAHGQNSYGHCLEHGIGIAQNIQDAVKYYRLAADQGHAEGQNNHVRCVANGWTEDDDLANAMELSADFDQPC